MANLRPVVAGLVLAVSMLPDQGIARDIRVASLSETQSALSSAKAGDTILLEPGNYGDLKMKQNFSSDVTIKSVEPLGANFGSIEFSGASHIVLDGVRVDNGSNTHMKIVDGSSHITVKNSEVGEDSGFGASYGIYGKAVSNITLENNYVHNVANGVTFFETTTNLDLIGNHVDWVSGDSFKFAGIHGGLFENNWGAAHVADIEGAHNDFMQFQSHPSINLVIRGNVQLPAEGQNATTQGIFGHLHDSLVENNIILTANVRGISVGDNMIVRNNTILDIPGQAENIAKVFTKNNGTVENNIWTGFSGGTDGSNIVVQHLDPNGANYIYNLFPDFHGTGTTLDDLAPVDGSVVDGKGAYSR